MRNRYKPLSFKKSIPNGFDLKARNLTRFLPPLLFSKLLCWELVETSNTKGTPTDGAVGEGRVAAMSALVRITTGIMPQHSRVGMSRAMAQFGEVPWPFDAQMLWWVGIASYEPLEQEDNLWGTKSIQNHKPIFARQALCNGSCRYV